MRIPLLAGPYQSRSVIASAQKSINLFPESNAGDPQAPVPVTHYPTPGLKRFKESETISVVRCMYRSTAGKLYAVIGPNVYYVPETGNEVLLGVIADKRTTCYMADNGLAIVLVDGTSTGYAIDMSNNDFGTIIDPSFYGADFVVFLDTYFVFNRPNTNQFYISLSLVSYSLLTSGTSFDPLDIAAKIGSADNIVGIATVNRVLILIGVLSTEFWMNTGAADFTFQQVQGVFVQHGCAAPYSIYSEDISTFWLSQDLQGQCIVLQNKGYSVDRISTHAIESEFQAYIRIDDAIGMGYQQGGHAFYILTFPTQNKTWVYELSTQQWHEWNFTDGNGNLVRHRCNAMAFAYRKNLTGDWQNGLVYEIDFNTYTDDGNPIVRLRTFPHMIDDGKRVTYKSFIVDMQTGTIDQTPTSAPDFNWDYNNDYGPPLRIPSADVTLRWSDDKGVSYGEGMIQTAGAQGQYLTQVNYNRLGMARDRIFEVSWSAPFRTALNGAFVEIMPHRT